MGEYFIDFRKQKMLPKPKNNGRNHKRFLKINRSVFIKT